LRYAGPKREQQPAEDEQDRIGDSERTGEDQERRADDQQREQLELLTGAELEDHHELRPPITLQVAGQDASAAGSGAPLNCPPGHCSALTGRRGVTIPPSPATPPAATSAA